MFRAVVLFLCFVFIIGQEEGDECFKNGIRGRCIILTKCQSAIEDIKQRRNPTICSFSGRDPIVCCPESVQTTTSARPVATVPTARPSTTTTEYVPPYYDYNENTKASCEPLSPKLTSPKTGRKAWDRCIDYQEQLVYPCEKGVALTGELTRANHCRHKADELIVGGSDASLAEFPHMVLLGFGDNLQSVQWLCGGALISDRFILTAGHCTFSRDYGNLTYAATGILKRTEVVDSSRRYKISRIIKHPKYEPPSRYNDIALVETETTIMLDEFAVPACLDIGDPIKDDRAVATGWGATEYRGSSADILQKVILTKFPREECAEKFPVTRLMKQGFDSNSQICYGDRTMSKDTCQGDSGGPLQIKSSKIHCMYTIVGVTSFGKACGFIGEPGIYTRVAAYTSWIESVVWP